MTNPPNPPLPPNNRPARQIECGPFLLAAAKALNHPTTWINIPIVGGGLTLSYQVVGWASKLAPEMVLPLGVASLAGAAGAALFVQEIRAFRGPLIRCILRRFVKQRMAAGTTYDLALGVNNGGCAINCALIDEWNLELDRSRPGSPHLRGERINCTIRKEHQGTLQIHPDPYRVRALLKQADAYAKHLKKGEKLHLLIVCDESRSGDTVNRLRKQLERPYLEIEVICIIRREGCTGRIDWYCLESTSRRLLPCAETSKEPPPSCGLGAPGHP